MLVKLPDNGIEPFLESSLKIKHEKPMKVRSVEMRGDISLGQMAKFRTRFPANFRGYVYVRNGGRYSEDTRQVDRSHKTENSGEVIKQECQEVLAMSNIR